MDCSHIPNDAPESCGEALQQRGSEPSFCEMSEKSPFSICMIGANRRILFVNQKLSLALGYCPEELSAAPCHKLIHPNDLQPVLAALEKLTAHGGGHLQTNKRLVRRDGSVVYVSMSISLIRDSGGRPSHFVVHIQDTAENKQSSEQGLSENEDRFKIIANSCPSMLWATDAEGNLFFVNRAYQEYLGVSLEQLLGSKCSLPIDPDDDAGYWQQFHGAVTERKPFSAEIRVQRAGGDWRLLGCRAEPSLSPSGEYLGHVGLSVDITARIRAEQVRQFEISLLRSIRDETLEGILVVNEKGIVVSHNRRVLEIWGLPAALSADHEPDPLDGLNFETLLPAVAELAEDPEGFIKGARELYEHPAEESHCEIKLKDQRTLEWHSKGLRDQNDKYLGRVWFYRDITEQRNAQYKLQQAKDLADDANRRLLAEQSIVQNERNILHALIDNIPDFMYVKDLESRFVVANPHLANVVGVEHPEALLGKTDFDFYPRELAKAFYEDEQNVIRSGVALYDREEKGLDQLGNEVDILTTKVPVRDSNGHITGIAGIGRDITARKRAENTLREAERNYRGIFDNAIIGIFQATRAGHLLSANPALAATFGYDSPQAMVKGYLNIFRQCYADQKRCDEFESSLRTLGRVLNFEGEALRKDGSKIWISMSVRAIQLDGAGARIEGMCEDITERNLLRAQLLQAQKLESVGQLAAGIAHEINTPTQYIGDNVRFLRDAFRDMANLLTLNAQLGAAPENNTLSLEAIKEIGIAVKKANLAYLLEEIPQAIDEALEGATSVATLVLAMKEFSHPGTKEKVPVDLNHAISNTITVSRNEWKRVAEIETDFDLSLPPIPCLPGEFNQVILNLIVNAAHAIADANRVRGTEKGTISIETKNWQNSAEIRIKDTGTGIPEAVQGRIFDPFFTTKEIGKGTGQGLAIARSVVVDKHGGTIHFETKEGKGTTFVIRIPQDGLHLAGKEIAA